MKKRIATALLCATAAASALAQSDRFWYGALDVGTVDIEDAGFADPGSMTLSAGYRMNRHFALEGGITLIGDSTLIDSVGTIRLAQSDLRFLAVGIVPVAPNVDLFGKAGLGLHTAEITGTGTYAGLYGKETTTNAIFGFGGQYNVNPQFGLRLQYERLGKAKANSTATGADISRLSLGGVLNF